ncbi:ankyrin repeat domain-containing protein [Erysipelothrix sp. HDW6C]|uniref:ankyrin repeat domain-containing protein n=1 Tax=Erysipelothrix sp. HDW6C TaxID=2714930 RepID=UPI00140D9B93|nr:ankyrin repeat domain-containing protein [Erysipelothrix sp. HDW6C]QIK69764.1 ankyrin repeat domain-containing protein [Erysipelothrix sp. HDW6C]
MEQLLQAVIENKPDIVESLMMSGFSLSASDTDVNHHSLLQIALQNNNISVARILVEHKDNLNFNVPGVVENWELPILHVAIQQAMNASRFPRPEIDGPKNDGVLFNDYLRLLQEMFDQGADIHRQDSYGNLPIMRAVLDALNIDLGIVDEAFEDDLRAIFKLLIQNGASLREETSNRKSVRQMFTNNAVLTYFPR